MDVYTGKLALLYDKLFGNDISDLEFYKNFLKKNDLILEIGSGTGRLLLPLLQQGFNIEGIEPSQDMIDICIEKANELNLKPIIYNQTLENLKLEKKYNTIFLPLYVFQNVEKKDTLKALENCFNQLENNGQIIISIFNPNFEYENEWLINTQFKDENEAIILFESGKFNKQNQILIKKFKFEIFKERQLIETLFSEISFCIYSKEELQSLLENNNFKNIKIFTDYYLEENENPETIILKATK